MTAIADIQQDIISEFEFFEDWDERYEYIIETGKALAPMPLEHKVEDNKIKGCQSSVWLYASQADGKIQFDADSDAMIVKGLIALLMRVYNGQSASDILANPPVFIDEIGMTQHLSQTRANGLASMVKQIRAYALALSESN